VRVILTSVVMVSVDVTSAPAHQCRFMMIRVQNSQSPAFLRKAIVVLGFFLSSSANRWQPGVPLSVCRFLGIVNILPYCFLRSSHSDACCHDETTSIERHRLDKLCMAQVLGKEVKACQDLADLLRFHDLNCQLLRKSRRLAASER